MVEAVQQPASQQTVDQEMKEETKEEESLIGQRVELRGKIGSIRYFGKLRNNPKAGDAMWLGIEWDEMGTGKHNGTVDGETYFEPEFHVTQPEYISGEA